MMDPRGNGDHFFTWRHIDEIWRCRDSGCLQELSQEMMTKIFSRAGASTGHTIYATDSDIDQLKDSEA